MKESTKGTLTNLVFFNICLIPLYVNMCQSNKDDKFHSIPEVHRVDSTYQARRDSMLNTYNLDLELMKEKYERK